MKLINATTRMLADALSHYICMRLRFRSSVLNDSPPEGKAVICEHGYSHAEG